MCTPSQNLGRALLDWLAGDDLILQMRLCLGNGDTKDFYWLIGAAKLRPHPKGIDLEKYCTSLLFQTLWLS